MEWADENPYFLLLLNDERQNVQIDLGASGWMQAYSEWMRSPGWWYLCHKDSGQIALAMRVWGGEQPYYTKRHIGQIQSADGQNRATACHGIGKKHAVADVHVEVLHVQHLLYLLHERVSRGFNA